MAASSRPELTRASFSLPGEREWVALEHHDGVYFVESATHRIGPLPAEAAHREAARQNEGELIVALADAVLAAEGGRELDELAGEPRFATAFEPRLAAAIAVLHERGEYDECAETERGPVVLIDRFLALLEPGGVLLREYDTPAEAEANFEVLCEEG
jgi:hypothetical protein